MTVGRSPPGSWKSSGELPRSCALGGEVASGDLGRWAGGPVGEWSRALVGSSAEVGEGLVGSVPPKVG